jgi:hypothetical protein
MDNPTLRRILEIGGIVSGLVLIAFGAVTLYLSFDGRSTVQDNLSNEFIVGESSMNPEQMKKDIEDVILPNQQTIAKERAKAGLEPIEFTPVSTPSCSVANKAIDTGAEARCFAEYLRLHQLRDTKGLTYSQLGKYVAKPNAPLAKTDFAGGTDDFFSAEIDPKTNQPVDNPKRDKWVQVTALSSALNLAYTADQIALFGIMVAVALLLTGVGLLILAAGVLGRRLSSPSATT